MEKVIAKYNLESQPENDLEFWEAKTHIERLNAIEKLDYPMIQGTVLFTAVIFVAVNLLVDIIYSFVDPKVKLS